MLSGPSRHALGPAELFIAAFALVAVAALAACGGGGAPGPSDPAVKAGEAVFMRICATCHGKDANGMPRLGKGLRSNAFVGSKSDVEMIEFLKTGRPATHPLNTTGVDMPPKGGDPSLTEDDLKAVVAYVRTLK